ncbi:hypothetical protein NM688_g6431 [Phlebia brevispora]|uniref:Uncharacterized protein n=1 Tax=Phlebia brevispora TaxID=194682 RepID=A0ACC1SGF1_9APHY|nr:hypothetical protein NM688_g6431 [Phlebia brevispora]
MSRKNNAEPGPSKSEKKEVYDPDQDLEKRRGIRRGYRELQKGFEDHQGPEDMIHKVDRMNQLFEEVKAPADAVMDSDILVKASMESAKLARAMRSGNSAFDVDDFISRLITFMGGRANPEVADDDEDEYHDDDTAPLTWERIGWKVVAKSHRVPAMDFMLGPLSIEQKTRQVAKRARLEKHKEDQRKPQEIKEEDITRSENETTKNVANIENILQSTGKINLFRFIINPNDFGQSVENLFYLSFLIRDGKCALDFDSGQPMIMLCEAPSQQDYDDGLKKHQLVMEFDMATWKRAIQVFNIQTPTIPQRPKAETRIGNKWYG